MFLIIMTPFAFLLGVGPLRNGVAINFPPSERRWRLALFSWQSCGFALPYILQDRTYGKRRFGNHDDGNGPIA